MQRFLKKTDAPFAKNVAATLNESVLAGTLHADLLAATAFVEQELQTRAGQLAPLGLAAPILTIDEIKEKLESRSKLGRRLCKCSFREAWLCWIFANASSPWKIWIWQR